MPAMPIRTGIRARMTPTTSDGPDEGPVGLLIIDKPGGITSHGVVARVRKALGTRKVGHAGTLDPMATGVLVIGVGRATRLLGYLAGQSKEYRATIRLGSTTTTDDAEGEPSGAVAPEAIAGVSDEEIRSGLTQFVGEISQVPSAVSAIKVDGKRAYDLVRAGVDPDLQARTVRIDGIRVLGIARGQGWIDVDVVVECGSGTYIRAIARDLGMALGIGGHLTALRRTRVGDFAAEEGCAIEDIGEGSLIPLAEAARRSFPCMSLSAEHALDVRHGRRPMVELAGLTATFTADGEFLSLSEPGSPGKGIRHLAVFVGP